MPRAPCVTHEWATLRHVIVGRPHYRLPTPLPPEREALVPPALWRTAKRLEGSSLEEAMPTTYARCREQMDRVARLLRRRGVRVSTIPAFLPGEEAWIDAGCSESTLFFPRDPSLVAGSTFFELNNVDARRRRERHPLRRLLRRRFPQALRRAASMPQPDPPGGSDDAPPRLDGGDCLVAGRTVFAGVAPGGSNPAGLRWLRRHLGPGWTVRQVAYHPDYPHLDCALCMVRPGLGLFAPDALPDGPPPGLRRWRWIEVDRIEALQGMAANALPLDRETVLIPESAPLTTEALRAAGHTVLSVPFDAVTAFGGGLRCWTLAMGRWD